MKRLLIGLVAIALAGVASVAQARNFHISGGVQYVIQGTREKEKGNLEDAHRIFGKAVTQLITGVKEDPKDNEAWIYLGQAYAEYGKPDSAGWAFGEAVKRLSADPKELKRAEQNRLSYWTTWFNEGITRLKEADKIVALDQIPTSTDAKVGEAKAKLAEAEKSLFKAVGIWPTNPKSYANLAVAMALQGRTPEANDLLDRGLAAVAADDPDRHELTDQKERLVSNAVAEKLHAQDYDGALTLLDGLLAKSPTDFGLLNQAAETSYENGQGLEAAKDTTGARAAYGKAAQYFKGAAASAKDDSTRSKLIFNYALSVHNSGDLERVREMSHVTFDALQQDKHNGQLHMMLARAYQLLDMDAKASEHALVGRALSDKASKIADITAYVALVPKASEGAKLVAERGAPDEVRRIETSGQQLDIWFYWTANRAFAMLNGRKISTSNLDQYAPAAAAPAGAKKG